MMKRTRKKSKALNTLNSGADWSAFQFKPRDPFTAITHSDRCAHERVLRQQQERRTDFDLLLGDGI